MKNHSSFIVFLFFSFIYQNLGFANDKLCETAFTKFLKERFPAKMKTEENNSKEELPSQPRQLVRHLKGNILHSQISKNSSKVLMFSKEKMYTYSMNTGALLSEVNLPEGVLNVRSSTVTQNGNIVIEVDSMRGRFAIEYRGQQGWKILSEQQTITLGRSNDNSLVAQGNTKITISELKDGKSKQVSTIQLDERPLQVTFVGNSKLVVTYRSELPPDIFNVKGEKIGSLSPNYPDEFDDRIPYIASSNNNKLLAVGFQRGIVQIRSSETGETISNTSLRTYDRILEIKFGPDDKNLFVVFFNGAVKEIPLEQK